MYTHRKNNSPMLFHQHIIGYINEKCRSNGKCVYFPNMIIILGIGVVYMFKMVCVFILNVTHTFETILKIPESQPARLFLILWIHSHPFIHRICCSPE